MPLTERDYGFKSIRAQHLHDSAFGRSGALHKAAREDHRHGAEKFGPDLLFAFGYVPSDNVQLRGSLQRVQGYYLGDFSSTAWNSISWTASTIVFENRDELAIDAGSATGLVASTNYIVWFDADARGDSVIAASGNTFQVTKASDFKASAKPMAVPVARVTVLTSASTKAVIFAMWGTGDVLNGGALIPDSVLEAAIATDAITTTKISNLAITTPKLAAGAVTAAKITAATITSNEIAANTIVGGNIAAGTITADKLSVSQLSAIAADMGTLTAGTITGGTFKTGGGAKRVELRSVDNELEFFDGSVSKARIGSNVLSSLPGIRINNGIIYLNSTLGGSVIESEVVPGTGAATAGIFLATGGTGGISTGVLARASAAAGENRALDAIASGAATRNYGLLADASGAITNWAAWFGSGNVHIANVLSIGNTWTSNADAAVNGFVTMDVGGISRKLATIA